MQLLESERDEVIAGPSDRNFGFTMAAVLALISKAFDASSPTAPSIISLVRSTSALCKSILLITGTISSP